MEDKNQTLNKILCVACLCVDRAIREIKSDKLLKFYVDSLGELPLSTMTALYLNFCWECEAMLNKVVSFKEQVKDSYRILQSYTNESLREYLLTDISRPSRLQVRRNDPVSIQTDNIEIHNEYEVYVKDECLDALSDGGEDVAEDIEDLKPCKEKEVKKANDFTDLIELKQHRIPDQNAPKKKSDIYDKKKKGKRKTGKLANKRKIKKKKLNIDNQVASNEKNNLYSDLYQIRTVKSRIQCPECDKTFSHRTGLINHRKTLHRAITEYTCIECNKSYRWKNSYRRHMELHRSESSKQESAALCVECDISFSSVACYQRHLKNSLKHVSVEQLKFICDHCNKHFADKTKLRSHIEEKHLYKTYQCQICNKSSKNRACLDQHVRNVHKGRPHNKICQYCAMGFPTRAQLESHIRSHTGERPFICEYCSNTFTQQSNLYKHYRQVHMNMKSKRYQACKKEGMEEKQVTVEVSAYQEDVNRSVVITYDKAYLT